MNDLTLSAQQDNLIIGGFVFTPTGMITANEPTFDEWQSAGKFLQHVERSVQFWIGDWLNYGERRWSDTYPQAVDETGLEEKTLRNFKYVAGKVPLSLRRDNLTFGHHAVVASMSESDQSDWLDTAEGDHLSVAELRSRINHTNGNPPEFTIQCPTCNTTFELTLPPKVIK